ncbi:MAG: DpnD/PcfM family protein [Planctomycetia bacterium]|nr:DpnD/PcfM family protein [Planctomycetia bacterium]
MKKYIITIEETVTEDFEILANNAEEARRIVEAKYKEGEIVLSPGEVQFKQMVIHSPDEDAPEWIQF